MVDYNGADEEIPELDPIDPADTDVIVVDFSTHLTALGGLTIASIVSVTGTNITVDSGTIVNTSTGVQIEVSAADAAQTMATVACKVTISGSPTRTLERSANLPIRQR